MTEKKKRGRPRKVKIEGGQLPESEIVEIAEAARAYQGAQIRRIDPLSPEVAAAIYNSEHPDQFTKMHTVPAKLEKLVEVLQDVELAKSAIAKLKKTSSPEPSYPSNWNELGKVAKLQWLTANRK